MMGLMPISPFPDTSSNYGSPNGSGPSMRSSKKSEMCCYNLLVDLQISTTTPKLSVKPWELSLPESPMLNRPSMPLFCSSLTSRACQIESNATLVSGSSGSARSWNLLGHSDGSTATGSLGCHGPGSSDDNRNTRRRLDTSTSPDDEQARSAVLSRCPSEQYLTGVTITSWKSRQRTI